MDPSSLNNDFTVDGLIYSPIELSKPTNLQVYPDYDLEDQLIQDKSEYNNYFGNLRSFSTIDMVDDVEDYWQIIVMIMICMIMKSDLMNWNKRSQFIVIGALINMFYGAVIVVIKMNLMTGDTIPLMGINVIY